MLCNDVLYIIDEYLNLKCQWCNKKISMFNKKYICVEGYYFCDKYCGQWLIY